VHAIIPHDKKKMVTNNIKEAPSLWKKKGVLQLALQLNFWIIKDTCNSLYLYVVGVNI